MGAVLAEFFGAIGSDVTPPTNMVELIPYMVTIFLGVVAVALVFKLLIAICCTIVNRGRF